jgi:hypothetical protein
MSMFTRMKEAATSLKEQLAEYRAGWYGRVPAERQAIIQRHIEQLRSGAIARTMLKASDRAPAIVLRKAKGETLDVGALVKNGPVIVSFYRDGCCPNRNLEPKAFEEILPEIAAARASLVAIRSEKPDDTLSTARRLPSQSITARQAQRCRRSSPARTGRIRGISDVH